MPRRASGPRLYLDSRRKQWVIRDGTAFVRTGCGERDRTGAEKALETYLGRKHKPTPSPTPLIDDVLVAYGNDRGPHTREPRHVAGHIANLLPFWSGKRVADIREKTCREYAAQRPQVAARRDLETLRAAVRYWHKEYGPLPAVPSFTFPDKPEARDRWLTRSEAARLLWAARRTKHLARFILIGLHTGTRAAAILSLRWEWIDLVRGVMHRRGMGEVETKKRRPPVRLNRRILGHLRRWKRSDGDMLPNVIHWDGASITRVRRSFAKARKRAKLPADVSAHTLRHTRATWLMQAGVSPWEVAGSLGMSMKVLETVYAHHHPDWQAAAAEV